ncbi:HAD family hydrolase [Citricoccus sp. GCM10030269]|uniref:HAD family hydrolase n=1 Tax=Citricoccus sp. GCM10030269 TaxID=3273388 RepID=UPI003605E7E7
MMRYHSVVFDLDGTLVDSSGDITAALNVAIGAVGGRRLRSEEVVPLLGEGSVRLVEEAISIAAPTGPWNLHEVHDHYRAEYLAHPAELSSLYAGVPDALAALDDGGVVMAVCTNKSQELAEIVLDRLGIIDFFDGIVGNDAVPRSKPDPAHVFACFHAIRQNPASGLYVGDSTIDEAAATGAQVDFLAVDWAPREVKGARLESYLHLPGLVLEPTRI